MNTITNEYFEEKNALAIRTEEHFAEFLRQRGWQNIQITEGKFTEYDIVASRDGFEMTWEIKTAAQSEKYGTYFIETYQSGYESALLKTTADYYIYYDERGEVRMMKTDDLRYYIASNNLPLRPTKYKTKSGVVSAYGHLVPHGEFGYVMNHDIKI